MQKWDNVGVSAVGIDVLALLGSVDSMRSSKITDLAGDSFQSQSLSCKTVVCFAISELDCGYRRDQSQHNMNTLDRESSRLQDASSWFLSQHVLVSS